MHSFSKIDVFPLTGRTTNLTGKVNKGYGTEFDAINALRNKKTRNKAQESEIQIG